MESTGAYRVYRTVVWLRLPVMSHIMFKVGYFGTTVGCVVGLLKVAGSNGFGST